MEEFLLFLFSLFCSAASVGVFFFVRRQALKVYMAEMTRNKVSEEQE